MTFSPHLCAAFTLRDLSFDLSLARQVSMFVFSLAPTLDAALAFVAGGAAGIVVTRVAQLLPAAPSLSLIDDDEDAPSAPASSIDRSVHWSVARVTENVALEPRPRTGRLPLPTCVTALTPSDEPALAVVNAFADRLTALPIAEWLEVGRSESIDSAGMAQRATAFAILEAAIAAHGLGIAAWYARDTVETSACLAGCGMPCWTARERRLMAAAHGAAEAAALALLARDVLAPTDFAVLIAPFEHVLSRDAVAHFVPSRDR
jgi:hypothetical protein